MDERIAGLDDRSAVRVLGAVTEDLREEIPAGSARSISSLEDARAAVAALLETEQGARLDASAIAFEGPAAAGAARVLLNAMLQDPDTRAAVESILEDPPVDAQKSPELAVAGAVVLGGLITWMQTSIDIGVTRHKDGTVNYSFRLRKEAGGEGLIRQVAKTVSGLFVA